MKRFAAFALLAILLCAPAQAQIQAVWAGAVDVSAMAIDHAARLTALEAQLWEDLRFPSTGVNLAGAPSAPGIDNTTFYGSLEFAGNATKDAAYQVQMPHGWLNGSPIVPHLHVVNGSTSTATSTWEIWYRAADVGEAFPTWTVATQSAQLTASTTHHGMISFAPITMTGKSDSCMLNILIRRLGGSDPHNDIIRLLEFDIHYLSETRSSVSETGDH